MTKVQVAFQTKVLAINRPDAFVLLKALLSDSSNNNASLFLKACMRVGRQLKLPFTEGVILASYVVWLEDNREGNLDTFLGAQDYNLVFGSYTKQAPFVGVLQQ